MLATFHKGGIHPPQYKLTAASPIVDVDLPYDAVVTFSQHIGAIARCDLKKGDRVQRGQIVAHATGVVSANVHTPISGTIVKIDKWKTAFGYPADTVTIHASVEDHEADMVAMRGECCKHSEAEIEALSPEDIISAVENAGIVGLGGATFPTKVKLTPPQGSKAELLIINGVECEPYLTCDHALMLQHGREIILGTKLLCRAAKVDRAVIAIEANKPDAIARMREWAAPQEGITVLPLKVKYPQGSEKQLIEAAIHKEVPMGGLPIATGAIVQNVATAYAVYRAVYCDMPLIDRVVTVTGPSVKHPGNYRVPVGTSIHALIDLAGGIPADTGKIVLGGPMMGKAVVSIESPTVKGVSGVLILPLDRSRRPETRPCIRCASCVDACPMGLEPYLLGTLSRLHRWEEAEKLDITSCIECGSCSYCCPASRPLLDYIRLGKSTVAGIIKARKSSPTTT